MTTLLKNVKFLVCSQVTLDMTAKLTSMNVRRHRASMMPPVGTMLVTSAVIVCQDTLVCMENLVHGNFC